MEPTSPRIALTCAWIAALRCLVIVLSAFIGKPCSAATYLVTPAGDGDFPTIQEAVSAAVDGDTISLANGTFINDGNRNVDLLGKAIVVSSQSGSAQHCIIYPGPPNRGFNIVSGEGPGTLVENIRIEDGDTSSGAIRISNSSPSIIGCEFVDNETGEGGIAGAIGVFGTSNPTIRNCLFEENGWPAVGGGALWIESSATIDNCRFIGNSSRGDGGAIYIADVESAAVSISNSVFMFNFAGEGRGGAIYGFPGQLTIQNCTIVGSSSELPGAAIHANGTASNVIITHSYSIISPPGWVVSGTLTLECSDLWNNINQDSGIDESWTGDLADQLGVNGNIFADPSFCDYDEGNLYLFSNSPCAPGNHPNGYACDLIGALPVGCQETAVENTSWSAVKSMY